MSADRPSGDFGGTLRAARERRGVSLRQIANATKISVAILEGLERNDISSCRPVSSAARSCAHARDRSRARSGNDDSGFHRAASRRLGHRRPSRVGAGRRSRGARKRSADGDDVRSPDRDQRADRSGCGLLRVGGTRWDASRSPRRAARNRGTDPRCRTIGAIVVDTVLRAVAVTGIGSIGIVDCVRPRRRAVDAGRTSASTPAVRRLASTPRLRRPATTPAPAPSPSTTPPVPAATDRLTVGLSVTRPCWVTAIVDGQRTIDRLLQPGEKQTIEVRREIALTSGRMRRP